MWQAHEKSLLHTLTTISLLLLLMIGLDVTTAAADADEKERERVTRFTAIDISCEVLDPGTVTVDAEGVTHIEGQVFKGIATSDNALITGTSYVIVAAVITPGSEIIRLWVTNLNYPNAVQGSWIIPGQGEVSPAGLSVRHSGYGTRDLKNFRIKYKVSAADVDPASLHACLSSLQPN